MGSEMCIRDSYTRGLVRFNHGRVCLRLGDRGAGRKSVVDEHDGTPGPLERRVLGVQTPVELSRLALGLRHGLGELGVGEPVASANIHSVAVGRDGAEGVLGLVGVADLPDGEDVQRPAARSGDARRHLHPAAGETDDNGPWAELGK